MQYLMIYPIVKLLLSLAKCKNPTQHLLEGTACIHCPGDTQDTSGVRGSARIHSGRMCQWLLPSNEQAPHDSRRTACVHCPGEFVGVLGSTVAGCVSGCYSTYYIAMNKHPTLRTESMVVTCHSLSGLHPLGAISISMHVCTTQCMYHS